MAEIARVLSDSIIIPFNTTKYSIELKNLLNQFELDNRENLKNQNISTTYLEFAISNFTKVAQSFNNRINNLDKTQYELIYFFKF